MTSEQALEILGLDASASEAEVRESYRDLAKVWHPDRFGDDARLGAKAEERLKQINEAYRVLKGADWRTRPSGTAQRSRTGPAPGRPPDPAPRHSSPPRPTEPIRETAQPNAFQRYRSWALAAPVLLGLWGVAQYRQPEPEQSGPVQPSTTQTSAEHPKATSSEQEPFECAEEEIDFRYPPSTPGWHPAYDGIWLFTRAPMEVPPNGIVQRSSIGKPVAPLTLRVAGGGHFLVKLEDERARPTIVFVRSGTTAQVLLPLGEYSLKYATGGDENVWCGEDAPRPFGVRTSFYQAEGRFRFSESGGYYSGHTIELIQQAGGNLSTSPMDASKW